MKTLARLCVCVVLLWFAVGARGDLQHSVAEKRGDAPSASEGPRDVLPSTLVHEQLSDEVGRDEVTLQPTNSRAAEDVVAADIAAQDSRDWDAYLQLRTAYPGAPENIFSYSELWRQGHSGIRGNVLSARLESIKPIPMGLARQLSGDRYLASLTNPRAFYVIVDYAVVAEDKYVSNGPNARLYILDYIAGDWKVLQVSEPPLEPLLENGFATHSDAEKMLLERQHIRVETGLFLNAQGQVVFSVAPTAVGDHDFPSSITVAHSTPCDWNGSGCNGCQFQYVIGCVDFNAYVNDVLPNEWPASWPEESLKAGAMAAKMVGWYRVNFAKYPAYGVDVYDQDCDQVYRAKSVDDPRTTAAVNAVAGVAIDRSDGVLFYPGYSAGSYSDTGYHGGRMYQEGTRYLANNGYSYADAYKDILRYYYDNSTATGNRLIRFFTFDEGGAGCSGSGAANIAGAVTYAYNGAAIPGAFVSWGNYNDVTDSNGAFAFSLIPCQSAMLTVSKSGYQTNTQSYTPQCYSSNLKNVSLTPSGSQCPAVTIGGVSSMATCSAPTVTTKAATNVASTSATFNATIDDDGGSAILERRFDWGIYPTWTDATNLNGGTIIVSGSNFSYAATGLSPNTTYQFRGWARNGAGWAPVGNGLTFTTTAAAPPSCTTFSITPTSANPNSGVGSQLVSVNGSSPAGCQGGNWNTSSNNSWLTAFPVSGTGSGSTTISWSQNSFTTARSGSVTVAGKSFSVTQSGTISPTCTSFSITPSSAAPTSGSGSQYITITGSPAGCQGGNWSTSDVSLWLTVYPVSGSGSGSTTVSWDQNPSTSSRSDSVAIAGKTFSVTQAGISSGGGSPHPFINVTGAAAQVHDLGVGNDGSVYVLFARSNPKELAVVKSTNGGESWQQAITIPNSDHSNSDFDMAVDSAGTVHVVWYLGSTDQAYHSRSTNGGASFSTPVSVRSGNSYGGYSTRNAVDPVVAADGLGNVYVAYGAYTMDSSGTFLGYNVWVSKSTNSGSSFQSEFPINAISSSQKKPRSIRATASNFYVLYLDETNDDLYFYRSTAGALASNSRVNSHADSVQYSGDFVVGPGETTFYAVYSDTFNDTEGNITFCKSTDGGSNWSTCRTVNDNTYRWQEGPAIDIDSAGRLHVAWSDLRGDEYQTFYAYSTDGGTVFSTNVDVSEPFTDSRFTQAHVVVDNGSASLYLSATREVSQVMVARRSSAVQAPTDLTPPTGSIVVNSDATYTSSTSVTLTLSATDAVGVVGYYTSNSSTNPSAGQAGWVSVNSTTSLSGLVNGWPMIDGEGSKSVRVWFKDAAGNVSARRSDAIILDLTPPTNPTLTATAGARSVQLSWSGQSDALSGVASTKLIFAVGLTPPANCSGSALATSSPYTHFGLTAGQPYSYRVCATDNAGNMSSGATATATPLEGASRVRNDVDADAKADLFWRNSANGSTSIWFMNGTTYSSAANAPSMPTVWTPAVAGDFDGDGRTDFFWRNASTGGTWIWLGWNGATFATQVASLTIPVEWVPVAAGDINGDGKADIFWRNGTTGETSIWFMNGSTYSSAIRSTTVATSWVPTLLGDFDGDTKSDLFWRNPSTGETSLWMGWNGAAFAVQVRSVTAPPVWVPMGAGDITGDTRSDIFWRNSSTGETSMWLMNGANTPAFAMTTLVPMSWSPAAFGDYNGDSRTDVFWRNPSTGETSIWMGWTGTAFATQVRGNTVLPTTWVPFHSR